VETVLLVAAEAIEFSGLLCCLKRAVRLQWPVDYSRSGELNGRRLLLVANGPGAKLAGEAFDTACAKERIEKVVSTGFCGALDPTLEPGDVFVATQVQSAEGEASYPALLPVTSRRYRTGALISGDRVVQTADEKKILNASGASVVDMEAGAVARRAAERGAALYCVRAITDAANEGFVLDFNAMRDLDGRFSRLRMMRAACRRPAVALELLRIRRRCRRAAHALGDFFAHCEF
jgi:adenosylhomocysteine nucleosidase